MMKNHSFLLLALSVIFSVSAHAETLERNEGTLLIKNVTVFDATGRQPFIADVMIEHGRFVAIGQQLATASDTKVIAGDGLSLLPGLIDVHMHWTTMGGVSRADIATKLLLSGVTTATDYHSAPESFDPKRKWHTQLISPDVKFVARTSTPGGHGANWGDQHMTRLAVSPLEGKTVVDAIAPQQPDVIKVFADGWRYFGSVNNTSMNSNTLAAIVEQAALHGLPVVTHTVTVQGAKTAAEAGVTAIVHAIQDRNVDDELVELMLDKGVYYAPTLAVYEPREDKTSHLSEQQMQPILRRQQASRNNLQRLAAAGVPIALGTDAGIAATYFGESTLRELELLVDFGVSPEQALIAGSANSAAVLGLKEDRGSIEVGKRADFVLVRGQPWHAISEFRNIVSVFVHGVQVVANGQLVGEQAAGLPPAVTARPLIDDFERTDGLTAALASRLTDVDINFPRSDTISQLVARNGTGRVLQFVARMAVKESPFAFVVLPLTPGGFGGVDASHFSGIRFDVRGDGGEYQIEVVSAAGTSVFSFEAGRQWQTLEVPFTQFESSGIAVTKDMIFAIKAGARRASGETFWMELDNISFEKF